MMREGSFAETYRGVSPIVWRPGVEDAENCPLIVITIAVILIIILIIIVSVAFIVITSSTSITIIILLIFHRHYFHSIFQYNECIEILSYHLRDHRQGQPLTPIFVFIVKRFWV